MQRVFLSLLFLILAVSGAFAQTDWNLSGKVQSKDSKPLNGAIISIYTFRDSSIIQSIFTDSSGRFYLDHISRRRILLKFMMTGYLDKWIPVANESNDQILPTVILEENSRNLGKVTITGKLPVSRQKGDTTEFNAGAFKTNPDATSEDLVTKMPGVVVQDGKIQAQGEDVKQVLIDGKPAFGDDPNAVLKNLPAEVVDKVQVYDKKSDQSQLTGFDDGNSSKTINIITKPQFRNGTFGKIWAGYGTDDRWKGVANINKFKNKSRLTVLINTNNTNEQNFSSDDMLGPLGGGNGRGMNRPAGMGGGMNRRNGGGNNVAEQFQVDQKNGITQTQAAGINYTNQFGKLEFSGSYFLNYTKNTALSDLLRTYTGNFTIGRTYLENSNNLTKNLNHRFNFRLEWKTDSMNLLLLQPKLTTQNAETNYLTQGINKADTTSLNSSNSNTLGENRGLNISMPVLYKHSFKKKGRSVTLNLNPSYNQSNNQSELKSALNYYGNIFSTDSINQLAQTEKQGYNLGSGIIWTEMPGIHHQLLFNYNYSLNASNSDKRTNREDSITYIYNLLDTALSNVFQSLYQSHSAGVGYKFLNDKINITIGASAQMATLQNQREFPVHAEVYKNFFSILPNAALNYKISVQKNLRINFRTANNTPTVDQLQDVVNNNNPLQLTSGNAKLLQDYQTILNIRYGASSSKTNKSIFLLLNGNYTLNYIATSVFIATKDSVLYNDMVLKAGSQYSMPVNLNGYYNIRFFMNHSTPLRKIKSNLNINAGVIAGHTPGMINNLLNHSYNLAANIGLVLSSNISEKIDFTLSSASSYNRVKNTLQPQNNTVYLNQNTKFKLQYNFWKGFVVTTDVNHQYYTGLAAAFNQNYLLWNAGLGYKFLKGNRAEIRLTVFDILKQNNSVSRNITETYYDDSQTNVLQRYYMLNAIYSIRSFKQMKNKDK